MVNNTGTNNEHTARVLALLGEKLSENAQELTKALREAEVCFIPIVEARIAAQTKLFNERNRLRHPKDKELTDWDRKIMLDAHTGGAQAEYELLAGIEKALEQRIGVIRTLLVQ